MTEVDRARGKGETDGFMKILVDAEMKKNVAPGNRVRRGNSFDPRRDAPRRYRR
jgi:hypothetical protein